MTTWARIQSTLAREARFVFAMTPAVLAAARAFQAARAGRRETLRVGDTTVTVRHQRNQRRYLPFAVAGGALLGAATVLLASRSQQATATPERPWPRIDQIPTAIRAAHTAAKTAFHQALSDTPSAPTV